MTIEHRINCETNHDNVVTTACPFCEAELDDQQGLATHLRHKCEAKP